MDGGWCFFFFMVEEGVSLGHPSEVADRVNKRGNGDNTKPSQRGMGKLGRKGDRNRYEDEVVVVEAEGGRGGEKEDSRKREREREACTLSVGSTKYMDDEQGRP